MCLLSISYWKEYFEPQTAFRKKLEHAEYECIAAVVEGIREAIQSGPVDTPYAVVSALLGHHAILNPSLHGVCWISYLYPMINPAGVDVQANLVMAGHAI